MLLAPFSYAVQYWNVFRSFIPAFTNSTLIGLGWFLLCRGFHDTFLLGQWERNIFLVQAKILYVAEQMATGLVSFLRLLQVLFVLLFVVKGS
jgi:hypothetical protein